MIFKGLEVAQTGLSVQKYRMDIISSNLANIDAVDDNGNPYRRKIPVFEQILDSQNGVPLSKVAIKEVIEDQSPYKLKFDPQNPLADKNGYVKLPNIDPMREMVDMISAMRTYEANLTAFNTHKDMLLKSLEIIKV
ncbi:flagellar basal body rod protein FlgC [Nitratiruptor sp. YY09-18]|uniref:flagellar basal body rod protein FlgC n=1 Tax=Nitratiruptor sp. YY09-18 TaxID=2724901 RepID=UPI001915E5F2|nr:flagellar basal body rod protein FlgC [Nitratiruptor sp. YY09-18]BCD68388.1 flagellar basal-body rod protein FlgC [Nitratiruptor sp. YY09-18]